MPSTAQFITFVGVVVLGAMSPGLDFTIVVRHAAIRGPRGGMATALGIATGVFIWACASATGAAALIAASTIAFMVIKIAGAGYLIYLGVMALRSAIKGDGAAPSDIATDEPVSIWKGFRQGLTCNLLNPKVAIFFVALMPQFLGNAPTPLSTVLLGVIAASISLVWFTIVANVVGGLRRLFARLSVRRALDGLTGSALVALGVGVAISRS